ncbi:MAG: AzlD domain-containing protein [Atopobium sp.]|uniref:AzlD domain-containing protein n=1 Tax=Atopobium sp. TaxID=1872650 RepID=UPI002A75B4D7|nr:AzlD domain-containing protein [Atopobium sp.]MDY2788178.1 AzlD domain-containing protein [Atopobium sp.]
MSIQDFLIVYGCCAATMFLLRVMPMLILKGKVIPESINEVLGLIPTAAFASLVANDLLSPTMFDKGLGNGLAPLIASALVVVVARKTRSLVWCAVTGVVAYALLLCIPI